MNEAIASFAASFGNCCRQSEAQNTLRRLHGTLVVDDAYAAHATGRATHQSTPRSVGSASPTLCRDPTWRHSVETPYRAPASSRRSSGTGCDESALSGHLAAGTTFRGLLRQCGAQSTRVVDHGLVCGVRLGSVDAPLMQEIRYWDKLVDEHARGKSMDWILRASCGRSSSRAGSRLTSAPAACAAGWRAGCMSSGGEREPLVGEEGVDQRAAASSSYAPMPGRCGRNQCTVAGASQVGRPPPGADWSLHSGGVPNA